MARLELFVWLLCAALVRGDVLAPEDIGDDGERGSDEGEDVIPQIDPGNHQHHSDPEYILNLAKAVKKEMATLQEYAEAIKKSKEDAPKVEQEENKGRLFLYLTNLCLRLHG